MSVEGGLAVSDDRKPLGFYEDGKGKEIVDRTELPRNHSDHLSPEQAAKLLGVSPGAIYKARMRRRQRNPVIVGRRSQVPVSDIVTAIAEGYEQMTKERDTAIRELAEEKKARAIIEQQLNTIRNKIAGVQHSRRD